MQLKTGQKGFTLIELLLVLAVETILMASIITFIFQTNKLTVDGSTQITALEDIKKVAKKITADVKMSGDNTTPADGASSANLVMNWTVWYDSGGNPILPSGAPHSLSYTLSGGRLARNLDGTITYVGKYITGVNFYRNGMIIKMVITSSPRGTTATQEVKTYQFNLVPKTGLIQ